MDPDVAGEVGFREGDVVSTKQMVVIEAELT